MTGVQTCALPIYRKGVDSEEGMVVLKMKGASAEMIAQAVGSLTGGTVTSTRSGSTSSSVGSSRPGSSSGTGATSVDAIRQRIEFFRSLGGRGGGSSGGDRKSTRLNSSHVVTSYAVCRLKKKKN